MPSTFQWPYELRLPVQFRDLDAMGHVNNATYLTYLEQARNQCYLEMLDRADPLDALGGLDFVVARVEIDYLVAARHGDAVTVTMWPVATGRSSFSFAYEGRLDDGRLALRARTVLVSYDWQAASKKPLPEAVEVILREAIAAREGQAT